MYEWCVQKCKKTVPINEVILKVQAVVFNRVLGRNETFEDSEG